MEDDKDFLNFELLETEDGGAEITFGQPEEQPLEHSSDYYENLAEYLDDLTLDKIGNDVVEAYESDKQSRTEWETMTIDAVDSLGLIVEEESEPFEGACTATHPLVLEATIKFQSKASNELLPASGPVKTQIIGYCTDEIEAQAKRVREDMNYHVQHVIEEYYPETEKALFYAGFIGNGFKRKYWDPVKNRICDEFVYPDKIVANNLAKSLKSAERISFLSYLNQRQIDNYMDTNYFMDQDLGSPERPEVSEFEDKIREIQGISSETKVFDHVYSLIEQHCYLPIDENGNYDEKNLQLPYIVHVDKKSAKVLSIRRNYRKGDVAKERLEWFSHYIFVPTAGLYGLGYAHLLGNIQKTLTMSMRSLADAGQFANLQGGFKNKNARVANDDPISPGEFKDVEIPAISKVSEMFFPLPFKEPSVVLFQLMQELNMVGQKFADSTEQVIADSTNYGPVGTTMALLEASTRFFASVYKRCYQAQQHEFKIISRLIYDYANDEYEYVIDPEQKHLRSGDYDPKVIDIMPVADPNYSSQAQRISKAQLIFTTAQALPQQHNLKAVLKEYYNALEIKDIDKLVPPEAAPEKREPTADILAMLTGKPIAAFKGQDHDSHIAVKTSWLNDPANGKNQTMMQFQPVMLANIHEHQFMKYEEELGALQAMNMTLAEAAQRLARINQMAAEEAEMGSPAYMIARAELLKAQTARIKEEREGKESKSEFGLKLLDVSAEIERENNRAREAGAKLDNERLSMGMSLVKEGMKNETTLEVANKKEKNAK